MAYSEKELLLLSNFIYIDASKSDMTISETIEMYKSTGGDFTPESVAAAGRGGGLNNEQVCDLFRRMEAECNRDNSTFGDLKPARRLEQSDVRGICYTDGKDENPVIVFRGTGGTRQAWQDNMYGSFKNDTRIQKVADDFVKYECGVYKNCTVAGHSKGGNLSQYVTIRNPDKIASCVSFDGQGMSNKFINDNKEAVELAAGKIKSISANNDFVNILLTSVAGTAVFAKNTGKGANAHSSYFLLTSNDYDDNGNITSLCEQSYLTTQMKKVVDKITDVIGFNIEADNILLCGILGEAVASILTSPDAEGTKTAVNNTVNETMLAFSVRMNALFGDDTGIGRLNSGGFYFDSDEVLKLGYMWNENEVNAAIMMKRINETMNNISYEIASRFYTDIALSKVIDDVSDIRSRIVKMSDACAAAVSEYTSREENIISRVQNYSG